MDREEMLALLMQLQENPNDIDLSTMIKLDQLGPEAYEALGINQEMGPYDQDQIMEYLKAMTAEQPQAPEAPPPQQNMVGAGTPRRGLNLLSDLNIWKARQKNPGGINTFSP